MMKSLFSPHRIAIAIAIVAAVGLSIAAPASAPNYIDHVTKSSRDAFVLGNPEAKAKVVEYASYTCSFCGDFEADDMPGFKADLVENGSVSVEIRNYVRDPVDAMMSLLARCGDPAKFFDRHHYLMKTQQDWMPRRANVGQAAYDMVNREFADAAAQRAAMKGFMLTAFAKMNVAAMAPELGLTVPQARACVADPASYDAIMAMTDEAANKLGFGGTPSFMINDLPEHDVHNMATLRARLKTVMQ